MHIGGADAIAVVDHDVVAAGRAVAASVTVPWRRLNGRAGGRADVDALMVVDAPAVGLLRLPNPEVTRVLAQGHTMLIRRAGAECCCYCWNCCYFCSQPPGQPFSAAAFSAAAFRQRPSGGGLFRRDLRLIFLLGGGNLLIQRIGLGLDLVQLALVNVRLTVDLGNGRIQALIRAFSSACWLSKSVLACTCSA